MTELVKALAELPTAYHQLYLFRLPGSRPTDTGSKQKHSSLATRAPLVLAVLSLLDGRHKPDAEPTRDSHEIETDRSQWTWKDGYGRTVTEPPSRRLGILPTLSQWVRLVDGELWDQGHVHVPPDDQVTVDGECAFLAGHAAWILAQAWQQEITDDVNRMLKDCQIIVGTEEPPKLTCTKIGCGWAVHEKNGGAWYKCSGCGNAWGRLELHKMAERKQPKPIAECAELAGVHKRTLQRYKDAGKLRVKARRGTTELFDLDEVMQVTMDLRYRQPATA